jgi:hypothetical protein
MLEHVGSLLAVRWAGSVCPFHGPEADKNRWPLSSDRIAVPRHEQGQAIEIDTMF